MEGQLEVLAQQLEGIGKVGQLPRKTLLTALTHPDDVLGVTWENLVFEIADLDLDEGYTVFDSDYNVLYSVASDDDLEHKAFGTHPKDAAWFLVMSFGEYGYLAYTTSDATTRVLMLIRG